MLIETIKFEIRDYTTGAAEQFVVENTATNYELIATQRNTRDIHFEQMFSFDFERKQNVPTFILTYEQDLIFDAIQEYVNNHVLEFELDDVDQMA